MRSVDLLRWIVASLSLAVCGIAQAGRMVAIENDTPLRFDVYAEWDVTRGDTRHRATYLGEITGKGCLELAIPRPEDHERKGRHRFRSLVLHHDPGDRMSFVAEFDFRRVRASNERFRVRLGADLLAKKPTLRPATVGSSRSRFHFLTAKELAKRLRDNGPVGFTDHRKPSGDARACLAKLTPCEGLITTGKAFAEPDLWLGRYRTKAGDSLELDLAQGTLVAGQERTGFKEVSWGKQSLYLGGRFSGGPRLRFAWEDGRPALRTDDGTLYVRP